MAVVFSLQGSMAVGKTTAARYVERALPSVFVSYENPAPMLAEIRDRNLRADTLDGFLEIQRIFMKAERRRWEQVQDKRYALIDLGAEEIEFYTLFYPRSMGLDWEVEKYLKDELSDLRKCMADHLLYLDAGDRTLLEHKENDAARKRGSFDHYHKNMVPLKREWFLKQRNHSPDILRVDGMSKAQVGQFVVSWIERYIATPMPLQ